MRVLAIDQGTTSSRGLVVEDGRPSNGANGSGTVPAVRRAHGVDRAAAGLWLGLSLDTTRFDMVRAVLEGVALRVAEVVAAMAGHITLKDRVSIDGGMARNPYFCQSLADALGRRITVPATAEITALGCAMLAGRSSLEYTPADGSSYDPAGPQRHSWSERFADAISRSGSWRGPVR